jgi:hypothetical protein
MTSEKPDPARPEEPDPDRGLDVDAAFAEIVAHWTPADPDPADADTAGGATDKPADDPADDSAESNDQEQAAPDPPPADPQALRNLFRPAFGDTLDTDASWDDEGHFVPPPPPPLPTLDPRRKIAWGCLVGAPVLALLSIVVGAGVPDWILVGMVGAFVGGFVYLVATMGQSPDSGWGSDDGAVL